MELLTALVLLSLIATLSLAGLRTVLGGWKSGVERLEADNDAALVRDWLRGRLREARPVPLDAGLRHPRVAFDGTPEVIHFVAPVAADASAGLHALTLQIVSTEDGVNLTLLRRAFQRGDTFPGPTPPDGEARMLVTGLSRARAMFYGVADDGRDTWQTHWPSARGKLPAAVHIEMVDMNGSPADLIVALRLEGRP